MSADGKPNARAPNRLATSQSPYLLQHAHNPVDWWPWGAEAIAEARARGVPLFVSIGYSTCYWCHVMERESFEDPAAAAVLNRVCVPIKVDREERPDVDEIMMTACQVFTQLTEGRASGGWPLNVLLDPDTLEPFHAGTYYPATPGFGRPSFVELLNAVESAWKGDRAGLRAQGAHLARAVRAQMEGGASDVSGHAGGDAAASAHLGSLENAAVELASEPLTQQVVDALMRVYDPTNGGFGSAPKFPTPPYPSFLFETRAGQPSVERALRQTLDRMAVGGIFDQVGGGFHRYTVDATWTVPHFEKMLYDNAQLCILYAHAAERWGDPLYEHVVRRTLTYVTREMTGPEGRFFSAQDAEVNAREGGNYVWTPDEVRAALTADDAAFALRVYGLDSGTNFQDPHHPNEPPSNVLRLSDRPEAVARELAMSADEFARQVERCNALLYAARAMRQQPMTDDKTIAAWNGLMIEGFAEAARVLRDPSFATIATRAAHFVLQNMRSADGRLLRIWRGGHAAIPAFLEDYACMANGLLALERATGRARWTTFAAELMRHAQAQFSDLITGQWFDTRAGQGDLFVRGRNLDDGAVPSGISSALRAMAGLAERGVHEPDGAGGSSSPWLATAERLLAAVAATVREQPVSATGTILAARLLARVRGGHPAPHSPVAFHLRPELDARRCTLVLHISDGHHITAGEAFRIAPGPGMPSVHLVNAPPTADLHGRVELPLEFAAAPASTPAVTVRWQVCTDRACLAPQETTVRATLSPLA